MFSFLCFLVVSFFLSFFLSLSLSLSVFLFSFSSLSVLFGALCSGAQLVMYLVGVLQEGGGAASEYSVPCFWISCGICWDDGTNPTC